jgi:hypothetical protein
MRRRQLRVEAAASTRGGERGGKRGGEAALGRGSAAALGCGGGVAPRRPLDERETGSGGDGGRRLQLRLARSATRRRARSERRRVPALGAAAGAAARRSRMVRARAMWSPQECCVSRRLGRRRRHRGGRCAWNETDGVGEGRSASRRSAVAVGDACRRLSRRRSGEGWP